MIQRLTRKDTTENLRAGVIASAMANFGFRECDRWIKPQDFFRLPGVEDEPERMSDEAILRMFEQLTGTKAK